RSENFFQLPDSVVLEEVSSDEELKVLKRKSLSWSCVGLDTESLRGGKCALLQVSTKTTAFLIDLLAVSREQLRDFLVPLMAERAITKLGFGASEVRELKKLGAKNVESFHDMQQVGAQHRLKKSLNGSLSEMFHGLSLSTLSKEILGKPLNKEMRASNFARRPLQQWQRCYAALDAWILVKIWDRLKSEPGKKKRD
ncbi:Exonuclease mut-7 homolog (Exonuclease 3'-5' domain-containing protein 3), partial [Durusdinium trenchii]